MTELTRRTILEGAKDAFFAALLAGYCGGDKSESAVVIEEKLNNGFTNRVTFSDEIIHPGFVVVDGWHTNPNSDKSNGSTIITFFNVPIWAMSYGGFYTDQAIDFLKNILRRAYEEKKFLGGRGESSYGGIIVPQEKHIMLEYKNSFEGNFERFSGREDIHENPLTPNPELWGYHQYFGMALI